MINIKRLQDFGHIDDLSASQQNRYMEITRYNQVGSYTSVKITVKNFLDSLAEKLTAVRLEDEIEYYDPNAVLGSLVFLTTHYAGDGYVLADGKMYTDSSAKEYKNVIYKDNIMEFFDMLQELSDLESNSVVVARSSEFKKYSADEYRGKYLCDFENRIVRFPNLDQCLVRSAGDVGQCGNFIGASMPEVSGFFKTCYHGFDKTKRKYQKTIEDIERKTTGAFSVADGEIDKNYVTADLDLSNQSEKYGWLVDIGQIVDIDASRSSFVYDDEAETVSVKSIMYYPYILVSRKFKMNKRA